MNIDFYKGLFFGGIFAYLIYAILTLWNLESVSIVIYYTLLALIMSIHQFIWDRT